MKKLFLSVAVLAAASFTAAVAQPTLTSTDLSPVPGDVIYGHYADTTGITKGPSGANVLWDMTHLVEIEKDTTYFLGCPSTTYCDSFTTVNLVSCNAGDTTMMHATTTGLYALGIFTTAGDTFYRYDDSDKIATFPLAYLGVYKDTATYGGMGYVSNTYNSATADGWGSLKMPGGVFRNALRVHGTSLTEVTFGGFPIYTSLSEGYSWYVAGFHSPLLSVYYDSTGTGSFHVTDVAYYTGTGYSPVAAALTTHDAATGVNGFAIAPNPASTEVRFTFSLSAAPVAPLTITDVTGRTVSAIPATDMKQGSNSITLPVSHLAAGMYIARLQTAEGIQNYKFVVAR